MFVCFFCWNYTLLFFHLCCYLKLNSNPLIIFWCKNSSPSADDADNAQYLSALASCPLQMDVFAAPKVSPSLCCCEALCAAPMALRKRKAHWTHSTNAELKPGESEVRCDLPFSNNLECKLRNLPPEFLDLLLVCLRRSRGFAGE